MNKTQVASSNIRAVSHNAREQRLTIWFQPKGTQTPSEASVYIYEPITQEQAEALVNAESVGKHFVQHIRNNSEVSYRRVK